MILEGGKSRVETRRDAVPVECRHRHAALERRREGFPVLIVTFICKPLAYNAFHQFRVCLPKPSFGARLPRDLLQCECEARKLAGSSACSG